MGNEKPKERTRDVYRFELPVPAGKTASIEVAEERDSLQHIALTNFDDQSMRYYLTAGVTSEKVKQALRRAMELKDRLAATQRALAQQQKDLQAIAEDQSRLRANLKEMPATAAAYKRYLEKFDAQETEIEKLQAQIKKLQESEQQQRKDYEAFLADLSVE
jgi:septal ring factor EnvC (AmiA/AmiB activator)